MDVLALEVVVIVVVARDACEITSRNPSVGSRVFHARVHLGPT